MPDIAFIVEGQMEQKAIQKICPGKKVVLLGTGGRAPMKVVANFVETKYRVFNNKYFSVVVLFDREDRPDSSEKLCLELENELASRGLQASQFVICIADSDIETWILAHLDEHGEFRPEGTSMIVVDGSSGQPEVKKRLAKRMIPYHKTTIGVELLTKIIPSVVA